MLTARSTVRAHVLMASAMLVAVRLHSTKNAAYVKKFDMPGRIPTSGYTIAANSIGSEIPVTISAVDLAAK